MPGVSLNTLRELRPNATHRDNAALCGRTADRNPGRTRWARTAWILSCLGLSLLADVRGDTAGVVVVAPPENRMSRHLTDAQDRMGDGRLAPLAEKKSQANALYAEAMLLPGDLAEGQPRALDLFRQIVALDPSFAEAQVKLANILLQSGQLDPAVAQLQSAAAANPDSISIQAALGFAQRLRGQNDEARRLSTHVLTEDPTQVLSMRVLLEIAGDQDDLAGGVIQVEDILKAGGSRVPASSWLNLARLYLEVARGDVHPPSGEVILKTRLPMLQHAAADSPPDVATLTLLADNYRDLGLKIEAVKALQRAIAVEPSDVDLLIHCADLEADLGQKNDALEAYESAYRLDPAFAGLRETLGGLYLDEERFADAVPLFADALADSPRNSGLEIELGIAYEGSHQAEKAQACFRQVFDSVDCPPEAYLKLALFQLSRKEWKEAGATLSAAQTHFPNSGLVRFYEAVRYRYEKNYTAALACLAQVRTLATGSGSGSLGPDYYLESALTLSLAGRHDELEGTLVEALNKYPDNPELMNELAYFWADQDSHLPEALTLSQRAGTLDPDNGPIQDTWGWVYFQMGRPKDALPYLQRAASMTDNDPVVLQHIGDAYSKLGLRREAIATWIRALRKDPHNGDLANRINAAMAQAKNAQLRSAPNH